MEKFIRKFADTTAVKLGYDEEKAAVIAYGLLALAQMLTLLVLSSVIGIIFGCFIECLIIFFFTGFLRKFTGGAHSKTLIGCMINALFIIGLLGIFSKYALISVYNTLQEDNFYFLTMLSAIIIFLPCFILIFKVAPVDSPNKPIKKPEKIKRLKKQSIVAVSAYFIAVIVLLLLAPKDISYFSAAVALCVSTLWQCFTLTKIGHMFVGAIDFINPTA